MSLFTKAIRPSTERSGALPASSTALVPLVSASSRSAASPYAEILVVDDDPLIRRLLAQRLSDAGFEVRVATSGSDALRMIEMGEAEPHAVLLDASMPDMDGFDVLRRLAGQPKTQDIPVLMLTARRDREAVLQGLALGARDYLMKPIMADQLMARIARVLGPDA